MPPVHWSACLSSEGPLLRDKGPVVVVNQMVLMAAPPLQNTMAIYGNPNAIYGQVLYQAAAAPSLPSNNRMPSMPVESVHGYSVEVEAFLNKYKPQFIAGKYDPTEDITPMEQQRTALAAGNRNQEEKKSALKTATRELNDLGSTIEESIGQKLDRAIAAVGKKTAIGKEGIEIRARIHRPAAKPKTEQAKAKAEQAKKSENS
jgi:hypothetical protein